MATSIDPKSLRVVDLKEELGKRNLAKTGKKDELVTRLTEALSAEAAATETTETATEVPTTTTETTELTTTTEDESIPSTMEETQPLTEQTIEAPPSTTQAELPIAAIQQEAQVNDVVVESQSLDTTTTSAPVEETTTAPPATLEMNNTKSSEDSTMAIPSSPKNDQSSPTVEAPATDNQEPTLKRKPEEPLQAEEDKRSKMESKAPTTESKAPSASLSEATGDQNAVCIKGFVRPLITKHLQEFIKEYGDVKRFWIDPIKTHCYIIYSTLDQAANAFQNINGTIYPPTNTGKQVTALLLTSNQATQLMDREQQVADNHGRVNWEKLLEKVLNNETIDEPTPAEHSPTTGKRRLGGLEQITRQLQQRGAVSAIMDQEKLPPPSILDRLSTSTSTSSNIIAPSTATTTSQVTIAGVAKANKEGKSLDDLFLKTIADPPLYYLPVDKDVATRRLEAMQRKID